MKQKFPGEPIKAVLPAQTDVIVFEGVAVYRLRGSEGDIRASTELLETHFPSCRMMAAFENAEWLGTVAVNEKGTETIDIYELIVLRKVDASESERTPIT